MIIHTVIGNRTHPEYGVASIPFPIPIEEYPRIIEMLEALEVGDVRKSDCHVAEIDSPLPVLERLEDTDVNVDELDYLAKRLDSFSDHELQQFQAMAAKNCYYKLKDLINLTFSCQQVTVISDFSDLEAIGRQHFLNTHYGVTSVFAKCGEINAMCTCYNLLTIKLVQAEDIPCIEYPARFRQPLKVVCDEWMKLDCKHEEAFDSMLQTLMDSGLAESRSDFDPDWVVKHCSQAMH